MELVRRFLGRGGESGRNPRESSQYTQYGLPVVSRETLTSLQQQYLNASAENNWDAHINQVKDQIYTQREASPRHSSLAAAIEFEVRDILQYRELSAQNDVIPFLGIAYGVIAVLGQELDPNYGTNRQKVRQWPQVYPEAIEEFAMLSQDKTEKDRLLTEVETRLKTENPWLYEFIMSQGDGLDENRRMGMREVAFATIGLLELEYGKEKLQRKGHEHDGELAFIQSLPDRPSDGQLERVLELFKTPVPSFPRSMTLDADRMGELEKRNPFEFRRMMAEEYAYATVKDMRKVAVEVLCRMQFKPEELRKLEDAEQDEWVKGRFAIWRTDYEGELLKWRLDGHDSKFARYSFGRGWRYKEGHKDDPMSEADAIVAAIDTNGNGEEVNMIGLSAKQMQNLGIGRQSPPLDVEGVRRIIDRGGRGLIDGQNFGKMVVVNGDKEIEVMVYNAFGPRVIPGPGVRVSKKLADELGLEREGVILLKVKENTEANEDIK